MIIEYRYNEIILEVEMNPPDDISSEIEYRDWLMDNAPVLKVAPDAYKVRHDPWPDSPSSRGRKARLTDTPTS